MWARPPRGEGGGGPDAGFALLRYLKGTSHIYVAPPRCFYLPLHRTIFISVYVRVHSASIGLRDIYTNACAFRFYRAEGYLIPMHVHSASIGLRTSSRAESALFVASSDLMVAVYARVRHS